MKPKQIVVTIKGGMVETVFSNDQNVSVTIIDLDVKKDVEGLSNEEIAKFVKKETFELREVITTIE